MQKHGYSGEEKEVMKQRLDRIESQLADNSRSNLALVTAVTKITVSMEGVSEAITEIKNSLIELRKFEAKAEEQRKSELEHRDRLDRRIDHVQREVAEAIKEIDMERNRVWHKIRDLETSHAVMNTERGNNKITVDRWMKGLIAVIGSIISAAVIYLLFNQK